MPLSAEQIAALVERHAVPLRLWLGRRCVAADDVVQEVFCRLATLDPPPEQIAAWVYRVARNLAENQRISGRRRHAREQKAAVAEGFVSDPADRLIAAEVINAVWRLSDPLREVLTARIWGQLTFDEVGVLCGVSTATASRHYRDALDQLRRILDVPCSTINHSTTSSSPVSNGI
jgi:RNA polymerase sigma factor (sigma-70 family)